MPGTISPTPRLLEVSRFASPPTRRSSASWRTTERCLLPGPTRERTWAHRNSPPLPGDKINEQAWDAAFDCSALFSACRSVACLLYTHSPITLAVILGRRRIASRASGRRKVRTPQGAMPRNPDFDREYTREAEPRGSSTESATENKPPRASAVRVKRCGKSAPLEAQATRHGKPHRVQGQIGNRAAARCMFVKANRFRVWAAQTNDSLRPQGRRQNSAYSLPKIISFVSSQLFVVPRRATDPLTH